ncbi:MAG: hypothetical protein ACFHWX_15725 [Bacteroidota bacterium]
MSSIVTLILENLIKSWRMGNKKIRRLILIAIFFTSASIFLLILSEYVFKDHQGKLEPFALIAGIIAVILATAVSAFYELEEKERRKERIQKLEKEIEDNPKETKTAWELAQLKLESYLDRNLRQVTSIFNLTLFVMLIGFGLVIFGVYKVFNDPKLLQPAILVSCSGLLINFIGGTFLFIYKSTMNQARSYVEVLERINAVGMSIQILESIQDSQSDLKDKTTADIAKELLKIYKGEKR